MKKYLFIFISLYLLAGCSSKQYFHPEQDTIDLETKVLDLDSDIIDFNSDGATLENKYFVDKDGISKIKLRDDFKFLNSVGDIVLASDDNQKLFIKNKDDEKILTFDADVISASIKDNLLAFGTVENIWYLYDLTTNQIKLKEYAKESYVNDIKIANPIFLKSVLLLPTLDGKILVVDLKTYKLIKTINIDPNSDINNIMFLYNIDDTLIAATTKKLFLFGENGLSIKDLDIKQVSVNGKDIFVSTLDGKIIKYDTNLNEVASKKFKFAKFHSLASSDNFVYGLESQGYLVAIAKDFSKYDVYDFSFDNDEKVLSIGNKIYFEDEYISLP